MSEYPCPKCNRRSITWDGQAKVLGCYYENCGYTIAVRYVFPVPTEFEILQAIEEDKALSLPSGEKYIKETEIKPKTREVMYGIGQLYIYPDMDDDPELVSYGMWAGPVSSLAEMLELQGQNNDSVIIRFNRDMTEEELFVWDDSEEPGWVRT